MDNQERERELREALVAQAERFAAEAIALSDSIADEPEISAQEFKSSQKIVDVLRNHGIQTEYPFHGFPTAFKGVINSEQEHRMCLLTEYDALRGLGHACGHCASGSASVLAALALNELRDQLDFGVDIIGTPDEEFLGDKAMMAEDGVFDGYDFAMMVHMNYFTSASMECSAIDGFVFKWHGESAHAALSPWEGRNALNGARLFLDAVDMMRQQMKPDVRLQFNINKGGDAANTIPDYAEAEFYARAPYRKDLNPITAWALEAGKAAGVMSRTEFEVFSGPPYHDLHITPSQKEAVESCMDALGIDHIDPPEGVLASSDVGNVSYRCPAFQPTMSIGKPYKIHTPEFAGEMKKDNVHGALVNSADLMLALAAKLYTDHELMETIKQENLAMRESSEI